MGLATSTMTKSDMDEIIIDDPTPETTNRAPSYTIKIVDHNILVEGTDGDIIGRCGTNHSKKDLLFSLLDEYKVGPSSFQCSREVIDEAMKKAECFTEKEIRSLIKAKQLKKFGFTSSYIQQKTRV